MPGVIYETKGIRCEMNLKIRVGKVGGKQQPGRRKVTNYKQSIMKAEKKGVIEARRTGREAI